MKEELKRLDWQFLGLQNKTTHRAFLNTYSWALLQESVTGFGGMWTYTDQREPCLLQWQVYKQATKKHFSVLSRFFYDKCVNYKTKKILNNDKGSLPERHHVSGSQTGHKVWHQVSGYFLFIL